MYQRMDKRDNIDRDSKTKEGKPDYDNLQSHRGDRRTTVKPPRTKLKGLPPGRWLYSKWGDHLLEDCPSATDPQKKDDMKASLDK